MLRRPYYFSLITSLVSLLLTAQPDAARPVAAPLPVVPTSNHTRERARAGRASISAEKFTGGAARRVPADVASEGVAESAFAEGEALRSQWRAESFRVAVEKYGVARQHWRAAGDRRREAEALSILGGIYLTLSEYGKALGSYKEALAASRAAGDRRAEAEALNDISSVYIYQGAIPEANAYARMAHNLSRVIRDPRAEARALNNIGEAHYFSGHMHKALEFLGRAEAAWQQTADHRKGQTLLNLGYAHFDLREAQRALDYYQQSLKIWEAAGDHRWQALSLTAIGGAYFYLGEKQAALDHHRQAAAKFRDIGDRNGEAVALNGLGYTYSNLGEHHQALDCYRRALELFNLLGNREYAVHTAIFVGGEHQALGDHHEAAAYYKQALSRRLSYSLTHANVLNRLGALYDSIGERRQSLAYFGRALRVYRAIGDKAGEAAVLNRMGHAYGAQDGGEKARRCYSSALSLHRAVKNREGEAVTLSSAARLERDLGNLAEARSQIEQALDIVESLRTKVVSHSLRSSYFASVRQLYEIHLDVLMRMHRERPSEKLDEVAFRVSERARARSLLEMLSESQADISRGVEPALLKRKHELESALDGVADRQRQLLSGRHTEQEAASLESEIYQLKISYDGVQAEIRAKSPRYAALTQPQPATLSDVQRDVLDDDTLMLEYALGDERSYLWAVTRTTMESYELPPRAEIEAAARGVYESLTARAPGADESSAGQQPGAGSLDEQYWQRAAVLSRMVLEPAAARLGARRLLVVADGGLQYIPFSALPVPPESPARPGPRPLMLEHEVVHLPSASVLVSLRGESSSRRPAPKTVAVLADPVFEANDTRMRPPGGERRLATRGEGGLEGLKTSLRSSAPRAARAGFSRLPASREEADRIIALTPPGEGIKVLDFAANRASAMSPQLGEYRIVHFATHGILNGEHPELSGLALSQFDEQGRPQNGFLRLHDVYNLSLPVEVVVLSACDTGLGKDIRGEGLSGLMRGFMYAGASSVTASLWKVDDEATADFMTFFYRGMLEEGLSPAAALRGAQISMWEQRRWHSPYYWAAFVLQGDYQVKVSHGSRPAGYGRAAGAALALLAGLLYAGLRLRRRSLRAH